MRNNLFGLVFILLTSGAAAHAAEPAPAPSAFPKAFQGQEVEIVPGSEAESSPIFQMKPKSKGTQAPKAQIVAPGARIKSAQPKKPSRRYRIKQDAQVRQCDAGGTHACYQLGQRLLDREETSEARARFDQACTLGSALACAEYAKLVADPGLAALAYRRACDGGVKSACRLAAPAAFPSASPVPESFRGSQLSFEALCDGSTEECAQKGSDELNNPAQRERALVLLRGACARRFAPACVRLAVFQELEGDLPRALREYDSACAAGHGEACAKAKSMRSRGLQAAP